MTTLAEYRAQGGCVAFVPHAITHLYLHMDRSIGQTPDGGQRRESGLIGFQCDILDDGRRVVRLPSLANFQTLLMTNGNNGPSGEDWRRLNPELCQQLAGLNSNQYRAGPIG